MLGQAAAMLIPFPATVTAEFSHGPLTLPFDQRRTFAGATVAVLDTIGVRGMVGGAIRGRGCVASSSRRGIVGERHGVVHTLREKGRGADRTGFQWFPATSSTIGRHGRGSRRSSSRSRSGVTAAGVGILDSGGDRCSYNIGSRGSGGDTLSTGDAMVGIDGTERNRVGMVSLGIGMGERPGERQFLFISHGPGNFFLNK